MRTRISCGWLVGHAGGHHTLWRNAELVYEGNTVLFVGYQAEGTRGRSLVDGAKSVRIHGRDVAVNARVMRIDSMSAHADRNEILRWLTTMPSQPSRLCLVHGEPGPMDALKVRIKERLGWDASTPQHGETIEL